MTNSFSIHRFGKLLRHDVQPGLSLSSPAGRMLVNAISLPVLMVLVQVLFKAGGYTEDALYRLLLIVSSAVAFGMLISRELYSCIRHKGAGARYAMLPASKGEKYGAVVLVVAVLVPVTIAVGATLLDVAMWALRVPGYSQPLWQATGKIAVSAMGAANMVVGYLAAVATLVLALTVRTEWLSVSFTAIAALWMLVSVDVLPALAHWTAVENNLLRLLFAVQLLLGLLLALYGRRRLYRMSY